VLIAILAQLALGLAFALGARDRLRADGPSSSPAILLVLAHAGILTVPVALYFYVVQPAWTWHYLIDPSKVPSLAVLPLVIAHGLVVVGGWYLGAALVRADRGRLLLYGLAGTVVAAAVAFGLLVPRLLTATTYDGFQRGAVGRIMAVELGWAILVSALATAGAGAYVFIELTRDGRRVRAR
jgi:hypothetical protein